ncbi:MAG: sigma-70 family RNA polymerase sigma factor [Verrucomicrobiales bacterium]|nr:sigma-70 family RNA polymerase sigma factor [Verrucomicrobiales bacterium]
MKKRTPSTPADRQADYELMQRIAAKNAAALAEFKDRFYPLIYSTAFKVLRHREDTEDVAVEILNTVWNKADSYHPKKGSLVTWICTTARNRSIDRVRSVQRRSALYDRFEQRLGTDQPEARSSGREEVYRSDARRILQNAVVELTPEQREVIELAYFEGMTQRQISEKIHSPLGTVKARIRRGVEQLRGKFAEELKDEGALLLAGVAEA